MFLLCNINCSSITRNLCECNSLLTFSSIRPKKNSIRQDKYKKAVDETYQRNIGIISRNEFSFFIDNQMGSFDVNLFWAGIFWETKFNLWVHENGWNFSYYQRYILLSSPYFCIKQLQVGQCELGRKSVCDVVMWS